MTSKEEKDGLPWMKSILDTIDAEDIMVEALKDMVKDEIKRHIRSTLDKNPELRDEIKEAIQMYMEARARQIYATVKIGKGAAKLGLSLLPPELKKDLSKEVLSILEKEFGDIMDRAL